MKKVLVTGGAGYIGSHTVVELASAGYEPILLDDFSNSDERVLHGLFTILGREIPVYRFDCSNKEELTNLFKKEKPVSVIHFAAFKAVGESVADPLKYYRNNVGSLLSLLEVMRECGVRDIVFSSSCTIYGQPETLPVTEDTPLQEASSPYGYSKQVCERMITDTCFSDVNFNAALLRYFNPIGAHVSGLIGELPYGVPNNLVPFIAQTAAGLLKELVIYGDDYNTIDGSCIRDYIHVVDLAQAHVRALNWLEKNKSQCESFNLGQGIGHTVLEVVQAFERVNEKKVNYRIGQRRSGDVEKIWADVSKANTMLQWKTIHSLEDALRDAWRWQMRLESAGIRS